MNSKVTAEQLFPGPGQAGAVAPGEQDDQWLPALSERLNRPLTERLCIVGWLASIVLFVAVFAVTGPPISDTHETIYGTWAIAHGDIACAYPSVGQPGEPPPPPLYPLLSGGIAALARIGHGTPFPSAAALGPGCDKGLAAMDLWFPRSGALTPTTWVGCASWLVLMAGIIAWLRASGRGRRAWEPVTLLVIALLLPVFLCVQTFFHPQDLLALGLGLAALACARRDRWLIAGILSALAVLSQQYALLIALPLFVVAPTPKKIPLAGSALLTGAIVVIPLTVMTSGRALRAIALGTGDNPSEGGTVLWETHANGAAAVLLFRVAPIVVSVVLSWWVARRIGSSTLAAVPLISLIAVSLSLRLVFEANLFAYYFMALSVTMVLLEVTRGSVRRTAVAWLAALTLVTSHISVLPFGPTRWGGYVQKDLIPLLIGGAALLAILALVVHDGDRRHLWPWVAVVAVDLFTLLPGGNAFSAGNVIWFWQVVLVVPGLLLVAQALRTSIMVAAATEPRDGEQEQAASPAIQGRRAR